MKNLYEVFDEFESATNKEGRNKVIGDNLSKTLVQVLELTFHPKYEWLIKDIPENYSPSQDTKNGLSRCQLSTEIRKLYMFQKGHPTAEALTPKRRNELLIILLESLEPREAEVVMGIFRKDQGVKGLTYKFVKESFPSMLP